MKLFRVRLLNSIFICALAALLFSCKSIGHEQQNIKNRLEAWDNIIDNNPKAIIDSLETINPERLSKSNVAYYNLLSTIARHVNYYNIKNDSVINQRLTGTEG